MDQRLFMLRILLVGGLLAMPGGLIDPAWANDLPTEQYAIGTSYQRLEAAVLRLSDSLAETDPSRSSQLRDVVRAARNQRIADRFAEVVSQLEQQRLSAAARGQSGLVDQLDDLLGLLSADPRAALLEKRKEWARELAAEIEAAERQQRSLREGSGSEADSTRRAKEQRELADQVERLAQQAEQDPLRQPGDENRSAAAPLQQAAKRMQAAEQKMAGSEQDDADADQSAAIEQLQEARRKLEELLRQIREEEQQQRLASLGERLREMVRRQSSIGEDTTQLYSESSALTRVVRGTYADLAVRERGVVEIAKAGLRLIEAEDSSVAFAFAMQEVTLLLNRTADRLEGFDLGDDVLAWQQEALGLLSDMVEAVDRELADRRASEQSGGSTSESAGDRRLTGLISDLKMLRRLQEGVQRRTRVAEPDEAQQLAERQQRITEATQAVIRRMPSR